MHALKPTVKKNQLYHSTSIQISNGQNNILNILGFVLRQLPVKTVIADPMSAGSGICNARLILLTVLDLEKNNVVLRDV